MRVMTSETVRFIVVSFQVTPAVHRRPSRRPPRPSGAKVLWIRDRTGRPPPSPPSRARRVPPMFRHRARGCASVGGSSDWSSSRSWRSSREGRSACVRRAERPRSAGRQRGTMGAGGETRLGSLSRWGEVRHGSDRDADRGRRERGGREGRAPAVGGHRHLSDHAVLRDGRARGRLVRRRTNEPVGRRPAGDRDAERGRRGRGAARGSPGRRAVHDVHGVARPPADDPQHVQDRRRAHAGRDPRRRADARDARAVDLRRPERRDGGPADRLGDAGVLGRAGGPGPGRDRPHGHARDAACRSCTSSTASGPRTR